MRVFVRGRPITVKPDQAIGKGGEADVYDIGGGLALKLFKTPSHPDLAYSPEQQQAAAARLAEHQKKLREFPGGLPERVVAPLDLATDRPGGAVVGYTMRLLQNAEVLLRYGEPSFRQQGVRSETVVAIFRDLHGTLSGLHRLRIVVGDFNDLNVLVAGVHAYLIDADSFQFGPYLARVFTERFVDPLLCEPAMERALLCRPHNGDSDWYAFNVMLFRSLLLVDPYGGVYKPADLSRKVPHAARPLRRITVFDPEVVYPKPAKRYDILPDALLQHFHLVLKKDQRCAFPLALLEDLSWSVCPACGTEHARPACPLCAHVIPVQVREVVQVRGQVKVTEVLRTHGLIVHAAVAGGALRWLVHEDGAFKREDGRVVFAGQRDPGLRFALAPRVTWVGLGAKLIGIEAGVATPPGPPLHKGGEGAAMRTENVDLCGGRPQFAYGANALYWLRDGSLWRDGAWGPEAVGETLTRQTTFWMGARFGFGFYRAGQLAVAFVFQAGKRGIADSVPLPPLPGQLVGAACAFAEERCWVFLTTQDAGQCWVQVLVVRADGTVEASERLRADEAEWLAGVNGACATGRMLWAPTDDGLVRVEVEAGRIAKTRTFPDTEPFMDASCRLLLAPDGLYVVREKTIARLVVG
jgi:H/ACA ribonucleoprotein complex subunit 3